MTDTPVTLIEVTYPVKRGRIGLRGNHAPLSWEHTEWPTESNGDQHLFKIDVEPGKIIELKLVRNEEEWAGGRNYVVHAGDHLILEPYFDHQGGTLVPLASLPNDESIAFEVYLPPSYDEQENKRYPVLYCQDGQSLWSKSEDPFGVWSLDVVLDGLYELGALEELIVVGVHTAMGRMERLTPVPDPKHGGGEGAAYLQALVEKLIPFINENYRSKTERENTALLGSSLGGLFSFYAAWTRPDVFGKAACLSSSFWWNDRHMVREVQQGAAPEPKPLIYMDSGAAFNPQERDANIRDGFHHTRSMFRALTTHEFAPGKDLHRLVFAGETHDAPAWSQRVTIPLQMLFPVHH